MRPCGATPSGCGAGRRRRCSSHDLVGAITRRRCSSHDAAEDRAPVPVCPDCGASSASGATNVAYGFGSKKKSGHDNRHAGEH
eukprot:scaffold88571_cov54-Phaeocystis_antarctica.AAC.2